MRYSSSKISKFFYRTRSTIPSPISSDTCLNVHKPMNTFTRTLVSDKCAYCTTHEYKIYGISCLQSWDKAALKIVLPWLAQRKMAWKQAISFVHCGRSVLLAISCVVQWRCLRILAEWQTAQDVVVRAMWGLPKPSKLWRIKSSNLSKSAPWWRCCHGRWISQR